MKKGIWLAMLLACGPVHAELTDATEIARRMLSVDTSQDSQKSASMLIRRGERKLLRRMEMFNRKYGEDERSLIRFVEPADVSNVKYLSWLYEDSQRDDDMWLYLPSENLIRRISGSGKKGVFMRSDFYNEDMEKKGLEDDSHALLRREEFSDVNCYVLEFTPKPEVETAYKRRVVWVNPDTWLPMKAAFYDRQNRLVKRAIYGGFKQVDGIWTITRTLMETPRRKSKTLMQIDNIRYNQGLADSLFEHRRLDRL